MIVGLHGGPGIDGSQLRYFLAPAEEWATVVVPDQRGHGRSSRCSPDTWTVEHWADDVRAFVDALGLHDVLLVGTSFGGFVVQRFLAAYPGVVRGGSSSAPRRDGRRPGRSCSGTATSEGRKRPGSWNGR